jgi:hypothetical protein
MVRAIRQLVRQHHHMSFLRHATGWAVVMCLVGFSIQAGLEGDFFTCAMVGGLVGYLISWLTEDSTKWHDPIDEGLGKDTS